MPESKEDQFSRLYRLTFPRVLSYVLRRTRSREDAADVVAEIFETTWRKFDEVPADDSAILWLYVTARFVLANHRRRVIRRSAVVSSLISELALIPLHSEPLDETAVAMRACLESLPEDHREILMLSGWEGLNASEIGSVLNCSATAARIRLHRARRHLASEMSNYDPVTKHSPEVQHKEIDHSAHAQEVSER
jgi:RNA polymerase sigma-70 factor (ECF subfamily)